MYIFFRETSVSGRVEFINRYRNTNLFINFIYFYSTIYNIFNVFKQPFDGQFLLYRTDTYNK